MLGILGAGEHRYMRYGPPPDGCARIRVESEREVQVHAMISVEFQRYTRSQPYSTLGSTTATSTVPVDALVELPFTDWYLVIVNKNRQPAAVAYVVLW